MDNWSLSVYEHERAVAHEELETWYQVDDGNMEEDTSKRALEEEEELMDSFKKIKIS